jgi:small subunit ribosomal protein S1
VLRIEQTGDPKRPERIALSIRALAKSPWSDALERYRPGSRVDGTVTRTQPFGAFVELEPGLEGMIHISELGAGRRVNHPDEVVRAGQRVQATVLQVDPERRRIGLSLDPSRAPVEPDHVDRAPSATAADDVEHGTLGDLLREQLDRQRRG